MKALEVVATGSDKRYPPCVHLDSSDIKALLGDFSFEKGTKYTAEITFEVTGWNKQVDGEESITLAILDMEDVSDAGPSEKPAKSKPDKAVKATKVVVEEAAPENY